MKTEMNIFEMFFLLLAVFISVLLGKYFVEYVGWWGVLPACILGFGIVILILKAGNRFL